VTSEINPVRLPADLAETAADPNLSLRELILGGLVDRLPAAVYVAEAGDEGGWIYASPRIEEILGYTASDMIAITGLWSDMLHPDDRDAVMQAEADFPGYGRMRTEYRVIRPDGQVLWVLDDAAFAELQPYGTVQHGLLYDVTEHKRSEMQLATHADILERVAQGEKLTETLVAVAAATERISEVGRCLIEVFDNAPIDEAMLVMASGSIARSEVVDLGPVFGDAKLTLPGGEQVGRVSLHYPKAVRQLHDVGLASWSASLATVALSQAVERTNRAMSLSLLEATLESTADGILVVDATGRIVGHNAKFLEMWHVDEATMANGMDVPLRELVKGQLVDPQGFFDGVERLNASPLESSYDELEFSDGRIFERYSQPQWVDGRCVGRVWSFRDMTMHRQLEADLRAQAFSDPLTPLANRTYFVQQLTRSLAEHRSADTAVALLLLDLDDFKNVNDSLGHVAGDQMLISVAERLRGCLRARDTAARLGGDEFVVLLENVRGEREAVEAAERVLHAVSQPLLIDGQIVMVRASVGISVAMAGEQAGDLLRNADLAMYRAKRDGGGRCLQYATGMHAEAVARLEVKADLERAIDAEQLVVHYQPVVDLASSRIVSLEALVRWPHPRRGMVGPNDFIPLAEETGLIERLGRWVLREACNQLALWRRTIPGQSALTVSVNLSPRQLSDQNLIAEVRQTLWRAGLPPGALILEITETSLANPSVDAVSVLRALKDIGIKLALDDFGVGYSSLGHLMRYPLDIVKVDKSFVDPIGGPDDNSALLGAVLQVASALSLAATVEGIETQEQLDSLRSLGCDRGQGYLLSRPVDAESIGVLLALRTIRGRPEMSVVDNNTVVDNNIATG
jgi:diguanylate cyclase (GGDEF)-like protein/PAS domain S-box-containing protein